MSGGVRRSRLVLYLVAFACALGAVLVLLVSGVTRSLGAGYSLIAIALAVVAIVLGVVAARP